MVRIPRKAEALLGKIDVHISEHRIFPTPAELYGKKVSLRGAVLRNLRLLENAQLIRRTTSSWGSATRINEAALALQEIPPSHKKQKTRRGVIIAKNGSDETDVLAKPKLLSQKINDTLYYIYKFWTQQKAFPSPAIIAAQTRGKKATTWDRGHMIQIFQELESKGLIARKAKPGKTTAKGVDWAKFGRVTPEGALQAQKLSPPKTGAERVVKFRPGGGGVAADGGTRHKKMLFPADVLGLDDIIQTPDRFGKLGVRVRKAKRMGRQMGRTIKTFSLEEGATCDPNCGLKELCFAGKMSRQKRILYEGEKTDRHMAYAISQMGGHHYRINTIGDIPTESFLVAILAAFAVTTSTAFGYTHWQPENYLGSMIRKYSDIYWDWFAIRTSYEHGSREPLEERGAVVVKEFAPEVLALHKAIACPEQMGLVNNCASCGLCWTTRQNIAFKEH